MVYQVKADDDTLLDAHFEVEGHDVVFHSRGGARNSGVNLDYGPALRVILARLELAEIPVLRAYVDSSRVQAIAIHERTILDERDAGIDPPELYRRLTSRMQSVGRPLGGPQSGGNPTKRIRLQLPADLSEARIASVLRGVRASRDFRATHRLPVSELHRVTAEHLWNAVRQLVEGYSNHAFHESTDFDVVLDSGLRLPPKAVFGLAASDALGFAVQPKHFTAGLGSPCFRALEKAGYAIVQRSATPSSKGRAEGEVVNIEGADREWVEGGLKLRKHLQRERSAGLREAKKAEFRRLHDGRLYCEHCEDDLAAKYGREDADACIEVHHRKVQVAEMAEGHLSVLADLACLCANCHRVEHRRLRKGVDS